MSLLQINLDSLRRASARLFFNQVFSSAEFSDEIANIYTAHSSRFQELLNVLQEVTMQYLDSVKIIDGKGLCKNYEYCIDSCYREVISSAKYQHEYIC